MQQPPCALVIFNPNFQYDEFYTCASNICKLRSLLGSSSANTQKHLKALIVRCMEPLGASPSFNCEADAYTSFIQFEIMLRGDWQSKYTITLVLKALNSSTGNSFVSYKLYNKRSIPLTAQKFIIVIVPREIKKEKKNTLIAEATASPTMPGLACHVPSPNEGTLAPVFNWKNRIPSAIFSLSTNRVFCTLV